MTPAYIAEFVIPAALALLPAKMDTPAARAMLLAIGLQESKFAHRVQMLDGPAHGFWQFEGKGATRGVLRHAMTRPLVLETLHTLAYPTQVAGSALELEMCHEAIINNDTLACVFARLLLWTDQQVLPTRAQAPKAWGIYINTWRPGEPHPDTWDANFALGWRTFIRTSPVVTAAVQRALGDPRV